MSIGGRGHPTWWMRAHICALIVLVAANPLLADTAEGIIQGGNQVKVNGRVLLHSQVGLPGDEIRTFTDSASVVGKGNNIQLRTNTIAKLGDRKLELTCGTAQVKTVENFTT